MTDLSWIAVHLSEQSVLQDRLLFEQAAKSSNIALELAEQSDTKGSFDIVVRPAQTRTVEGRCREHRVILIILETEDIVRIAISTAENIVCQTTMVHHKSVGRSSVHSFKSRAGQTRNARSQTRCRAKLPRDNEQHAEHNWLPKAAKLTLPLILAAAPASASTGNRVLAVA